MMSEVSLGWHGFGPRLDGYGATRVFHHVGTNASHWAWIEDYLASNDLLELAPPVVQQIPTLSLGGLLLLAIGGMVGAWTGVPRSG